MPSILDYLERYDKGVAYKDDIFRSLIEPWVEVCSLRPSEIDEQLVTWCSKHALFIGKLCTNVDLGYMTEQEAIEQATFANSCLDCPLRIISNT